MKRLVIHTKVIGRRGPFLAPVTVETDESDLTVRGLLSCVVREQVKSFHERQESRRLIQVLTERQACVGAETGRFVFGGDDLDRAVNADDAIEAACTAFTDQFFYVFVDNNQLLSLDASVDLGETTEALFIRLVPLVGG
jgi:hypothetical protein